MRPRKIVLCVGSDEELMSVRSFLFDVRSLLLRTLPCYDAAEAERLVLIADVAVVDMELEGADALELCRRLKQINPECPVILTSETVQNGECAHWADWLLGKNHTPQELMDRVRIMAKRKRGPKKGVVSVTPEKEPMEDEQCRA